MANQLSQNGSTAELIAECDALLKRGRIGAVSAMIGKLNLAKVPRRDRRSIAKVCRRAGLIHKGLRLLQPIIRSDRIQDSPASAGEIAEYAVLLSRNGSVEEAMRLLAEVDPVAAPESLLYLGFCHVLRWEYESANQYFQRILESESYDSYTKLVARVNLAAGLLALSATAEAETTLSEALVTAKSHNADRLIANILEMRGGSRVLSGQFSAARDDLDAALRLVGGSRSYDQLLVNKWTAVMASYESRSVEPLRAFREEALFRKHWESAREADLFTVKINFSQTLFDQLVFGTSMPAYRRRLMDQLAPQQPSDSFLWGDPGGRVIDLQAGDWGAEFKPGMKIHHLFIALSLDLYRPSNTGMLFSMIYPDSYFDVHSSPLAIRQLISRARAWLAESQLPLSILHTESGYHLRVGAGLAMRFSLDRYLGGSSSLQWNALLFDLKRKADPVSLKELCQVLKISPSSARRLIAPALKTGQLIQVGQGKSAKYKIAA